MWPDWLTFRPIEHWPDEPTPEWLRKRSPFSANLSATATLLERELRHLNAQHPVLQVALSDRDIRNDGKPRATARPDHPGVILAYARKGRSTNFPSSTAAREYLAGLAGMLASTDPKILYREASKRAHPDTEDGSQDKFVKVAEAYRLLTADDTYQFAADHFKTWQDNLRAIALGLEALRKLERYGFVRDDAQYAGWKQLSA